MAGLFALRTRFAYRLAQRGGVLGRTLSLLQLLIPRFPLLLMLGIGLLWRTWKERQRLSSELTRLSATRYTAPHVRGPPASAIAELRGARHREELQCSVTALRVEEQRLSTSNGELSTNVAQLQVSPRAHRTPHWRALRLRGLWRAAGER